MVSKECRVSINVSEEQKARWQEEADKRDKSMSQFVRHAVETYLLLMSKVQNGEK